jgi:hypothetical protein
MARLVPKIHGDGGPCTIEVPNHAQLGNPIVIATRARFHGGTGMKFTALQNLAQRAFILSAVAALFSLTAGSSHANDYVGDLPIESSGVVAGAVADGSSGVGSGTVFGRSYGQPDLFYNFYTQGYANQSNAQMYLSPLPVPPNVGHTFYTYQPFYPHEMMYWHKNRFHRYYDNGRGMNRTRATYFGPPVHTAVSNFYWNHLRLAR